MTRLLEVLHYLLTILLVILDELLYLVVYLYLKKNLDLLNFRLTLFAYGLPGDLRRDLYLRYRMRTKTPMSLTRFIKEILKAVG